MKVITCVPMKLKTLEGITELKAGNTFRPKNPDGIQSLLAEGKVKPVIDVMTEKYKEFMQWLKSYPITDVQIREAMPEHYQKLQDAIEAMDTCYYREYMQVFNENMEKVKSLYLQAMTQVNQIELTKLTNQEG